jgi:vacuolar protein sorting-associated protein 13A/C
VATLEFFCNRPTVVALTEFGLDISSIQASMTALQQAESAIGVGQVVFGLEGRGKVRTIFQLLLDMETARVYLNLETGNQLAVLAEERIHMDLKVRIGTIIVNLVSKGTFLTPSISILSRIRWPVA